MLGGGSSSSSQGNGCGGAFSSSSALPPARRHQHHHHHNHHHQQQTASAAAAAIISASSCWSPTNPFNVLASGCGGGVGSVVPPPTASEEVPTEAAAVALSPANFLYANYPPPPLLLLPSTAPAIQRKRPGCLCDHQDDYGDFNCHPATTTTSSGGVGYYDDPLGQNYGECGGIQQQVFEPLDLSLPKVKVRQHWSGGSIVQVNDSTIISISGRRPAISRGSTANNNNNSNSDSTCCCGGCCADSLGCPNSSSSRLDVSVVTVPQPVRPSCWSSSPSYANQQQSHRQQQQQQQQQQPFRLQIEIPFGASDDKLLPGFFRHHHRRTNNINKPIHCHNNNNNNSHHHQSSAHPAEVCATMTEGSGGDESDDLQRLSDSAHQLRLSGYYYGHLSWKKSVQLLQNTKVGTFLVRDSSDARYLYALSLQTDKGPTSVRIHYSSSGFRLDACSTGMADHLPRFRTVLDLVDHYVAKWSQCRDKGQFWLDNSGQVHSEVVLIRPLMRDCPSLKHLCRLACNQHRQQQPQPVLRSGRVANSPSSVKIPPTIKSYLNEYPYQH